MSEGQVGRWDFCPLQAVRPPPSPSCGVTVSAQTVKGAVTSPSTHSDEVTSTALLGMMTQEAEESQDFLPSPSGNEVASMQ